MISVVIPTRNRAALLRGALESLCSQTLPASRFEVVVVDNGSADDTSEVAAEYAGRLDLVLCHEAEPGLHVGRHAGLRRARHELLVFADDDIFATPTWLASLVDVFGEPGVSLAGGNNYPAFEDDPPDWLATWWAQPHYRGRALGYLSILDFGEGRFEMDPGYVWGCNFAVRREVVLAAGGFHPDAFPREKVEYRGDGETWISDWVRQSGGRCVFDSGASVHHAVTRGRMDPEYFTWRAYQNGISASYQQLRRGGGRPASATGPSRARARLRGLARRAKAILQGARAPGSSELLKLKQRMDEAFAEGFAFHQQRCRDNPGLLEWVLRETYL